VKIPLLSALFLCAAAAAHAQAPPRIDQQALTADVRQRADLMADQLALSPAERDRALPIVRSSLLRRWSALTSAWADGTLDREERARLRNQFDVERRGVVAELDAFLSDAQIAQFRRIQSDETHRLQENIRSGRYAPAH
jgi:hypothetical protein